MLPSSCFNHKGAPSLLHATNFLHAIILLCATNPIIPTLKGVVGGVLNPTSSQVGIVTASSSVPFAPAGKGGMVVGAGRGAGGGPCLSTSLVKAWVGRVRSVC